MCEATGVILKFESTSAATGKNIAQQSQARAAHVTWRWEIPAVVKQGVPQNHRWENKQTDLKRVGTRQNRRGVKAPGTSGWFQAIRTLCGQVKAGEAMAELWQQRSKSDSTTLKIKKKKKLRLWGTDSQWLERKTPVASAAVRWFSE